MGVTLKNYGIGYNRMYIRKNRILKAFLDNTAFTAVIAWYADLNLEINWPIWLSQVAFCIKRSACIQKRRVHDVVTSIKKGI